MFKKPAVYKPSSNLKSSARRKLLQQICLRFTLQEDLLSNEIKSKLAPKDIRIGRAESNSGELLTVYTDPNNKPLWLEFDGYLLPTVYMMWECPFLPPMIHIHDLVVKNLRNGADLMIPGVLPPYPPNTPAGSVIAVAALSRPTVPIAVGISLVDITTLDRNQKGKAIEMVHVMGDTLSKLFREKVLPPLELDLSLPYETDNENGEGSAQTLESDQTLDPQVPQESLDNKLNELDLKEPEEPKAEVEVEPEADAEPEPEHESDHEHEKDLETSTELAELSIAETDEIFLNATLQVLRKAVDTPLELPVPGSLFLSNNILLNLPRQDSKVQMKNTSWKKASRFYKAMEKRGLLTIKGKDDNITIQTIAGNSNKEVASFQIYKVKKAQGQGTHSAEGSGADDTLLSYVDFWKPHASMQGFLVNGESMNQMFTSSELKKLMADYIKKNNLVDKKQPKFILTDEVLSKAFGDIGIGKSIGRDKLIETLQKNSCTQYHVIVKPGEDPYELTPSRGPVPTIKLSTERRSGKKIMTKISNLEPFYIDAGDLADELRVSCAGSTTVSSVGGTEKREVRVQGPQIKIVTDALIKRGVPRAWIEVNDKAK